MKLTCAVCRYAALHNPAVRLPGTWSRAFYRGEYVYLCGERCEAAWMREHQDRDAETDPVPPKRQHARVL